MSQCQFSRRSMLFAGATSALGASFGLAAPSELLSETPPQAPVKPPKLDLGIVEAFVRAGHVDLDKTKALLAQEPGLLNAAWDWGGGDWETALGGAGHMGRREIALFLISSGARMDIFHAAMLGRLDIVKPMLTAFPNLAISKGPHGIPLMAHAQKGGEEAVAVVRFLESLTPPA